MNTELEWVLEGRVRLVLEAQDQEATYIEVADCWTDHAACVNEVSLPSSWSTGRRQGTPNMLGGALYAYTNDNKHDTSVAAGRGTQQGKSQLAARRSA